jgi:hypothetical protein
MGQRLLRSHREGTAFAAVCTGGRGVRNGGLATVPAEIPEKSYGHGNKPSKSALNCP